MPPIVFSLRVDMRITIHFRCGGLQNLRFQTLGKTQHIDCPVHACLRRLYRVMLVMDRRGRAGEIVNLVDLQIERERDVVPDHLEMFVIEQLLDVASSAGKEIIDTNHHCAISEQALAKMRAKKASAAGNKNAFLKMHGSFVP